MTSMTSKILVVDDEPDLPLLIQQRFRREIKDRAFEFRFAANGAEALTTLEREPDIDIVLSDINMPEMDGLTLLGRITDRGPMPKAVMVSAYGDLQNIRTAMNRGAFDFVTKPVDFKDLQTTIEKTQRELTLLKDALRTRDELVGVRRELQIASSIQRALLPRGLPADGAGERYGLSAEVIPAREVGGDFYDYFLIDDRHLGFLVADVSGKGVGAAIYTAVCRTLLRAKARENPDPGQCLAAVNDALVNDGASSMFVTVCYGILDLETGEIAYAKGGHPPPFVVGASGARQLDLIGGMVIGMIEDQPFETIRVRLAPGEFFVTYSDGVNEAMNDREELYSLERLTPALDGCPRTSCQTVTQGVIDAVRAFQGDAPQADDIAVLTIGFRPPR